MSLVDKVRWVLLGLNAEMGRRRPPLPALYAWLVSRRISHVLARLTAAILRFQAGTLRSPRPRPARPAVARLPPAAAPPVAAGWTPAAAAKGLRLPSAHGWMLAWVGGEAAGWATCVQMHILHDPEIQAMLAAAPHLWRHLRPLCHALAIENPLVPPPPLRPGQKPRRVRRQPYWMTAHKRRPVRVPGEPPCHAAIPLRQLPPREFSSR